MTGDIARLGYEIDSSQARTAASDLDKMNAAAQKVERGAKSLKAASRDLLRDESGRFLSAAQSAEKYGSEIEALRSKYNPLYAASKQFEAQQGELQRALALGAISVAQYDAALESLQGGMIRSGGAVGQFGKTMAASSQHTTNLMFQFQDIGMMLASGQNPLMLAMQQGTQVSGVFHQMQQSGQSAFQGIKGGLLALINPTSLLTIGVIAGGAALVQWGMSAIGASANAQTFHDAIDGLDERVTELNQSVGNLTVENYDKMIEKYGVLNQAVYDNIANIAGLNAQLISISQIDLGGLFSDSFGGVLTNRIDEMRIAFDTTNDQARNLLLLMDNVAASRGPDQLIQSLTAMRDELIDTAGGIKNLTIKQAEFILEIDRSIDKANIAKGALQRMGDAAPDGSWMNPAIGGIDALIGRVNTALAKVSALRVTAAAAGNGAVPKLPGVKPLEGGTGTIDLSSAFVGSSGSSDGGGGGSDPYADNLKRLVESLQTEKDTVDAWYSESMTILEDRRALEILGAQGHADALLSIEQELQRRKAEVRDGDLEHYQNFFGSMTSALQSGGGKMLEISKGFALAEAAVSIWRGAAKALELPFPASLAAWGQVIATGAKAISGIKSASYGGGSVSGGASATTSATSGARSEPERVTRVELMGEDWMVSLAESMMTQIYDASKNGRVIVARA